MAVKLSYPVPKLGVYMSPLCRVWRLLCLILFEDLMIPIHYVFQAHTAYMNVDFFFLFLFFF